MNIKLYSPLRPAILPAVFGTFLILGYNFFGIYGILGAFCLSVAIMFAVIKDVPNVIVTVILILFIAVSLFMADNNYNHSDKLSEKKISTEITVISETFESQNSNYAKVTVSSSKKLRSNIKYYMYFDKNIKLVCGQKIKANVTVFSSDESYKTYFLSKQTYGNLWLNSFSRIDNNSILYTLSHNVREYVEHTFSKYLSPDSSATLLAIMLGDKSIISNEFLLNVRRSGVSHVMVVSGMHFAVIMGLILAFCDKFFYNKVLRFFIVLCSTFVISAVCGFSVSVLRAGIMFVLMAMAELFDRDGDSLNLLAFTVTLIYIFSPMILFDLSFQLSVMSVFAVVYVAPFFTAKLKQKLIGVPKIFTVLLEIIIVTLSAQLFTLPITIYNFGTLSLVSPLTNIFISFPVTVMLQTAFIALLFSPVPLINLIPKLLFYFVNYLAKYVNIVINYFGSLKYAAIDVQRFFTVFAVLLDIGILYVIYIIKKGDEKRARDKRRQAHSRN